MSLRLLGYLLLGTILMFIPVMMEAKWYPIKIWKSVIVTICLTIVGTVGTYIMFFIESGRFGGISFYGAVFFVPIAFFPLSKILKESYAVLMDICAPAECVMLAIMKVQCYLTGCCEGRTIYINELGIPVVFPSQLAELVNAICVCAVLLVLAYYKTNYGTIYPWYLIIYGVTRFILNLFRDEWTSFDGIMPIGNIWSLVAIAIGVTWLVIVHKNKPRKIITDDPQ